MVLCGNIPSQPWKAQIKERTPGHRDRMRWTKFTKFYLVAICLAFSVTGARLRARQEKDILRVNVQDFPFRNVSLPWNVRVDDLVNRLSPHELVLQMARGGQEPWSGPSPAIPRLGIGEYVWNTECLSGSVWSEENATAFPQPIGMSATFSPELVHRVAQAIGNEVRGKHNDFVHRGIFASETGASCFSPVINIARDPRWGRIQETYGEDPFLSGKLAEAFVTGLQGDHPRYVRASAGCKHFDVYAGPEYKRCHFDSKVSEYDWRNTFLPAFKKCVDAGTYSLMCSYNSINGVPACANKKLLTDILRTEWGFKGYVVSDDTSLQQIMTCHNYADSPVDAAQKAANAGTNLELSAGITHQVYQHLDEALAQGLVTLDLLKERVRPLFYTRMRLGEFDPAAMNPYTYQHLNNSVVETPAHQQLALETAMKSLVLLKNDGTLPVKAGQYKRISVVGPMANNISEIQGYYNPITDKSYLTSPLDGIRMIDKAARFHKACKDGIHCKIYDADVVSNLVHKADLVFVALGTGIALEMETKDRVDVNLVENQRQIVADVIKHSPINAKIVILLFSAGPLNMTFAEVDPRVNAILECFFPAQAAGPAIYNILTNKGGNSSPAGRLPITWPKSASAIPPIEDYSMKGRTYRYIDHSPLYPFGYGLSYTTFTYVSLSCPATVQATASLNASVTVKNSGKFDSDEVIQCFIEWADKSLPVPKLQLVHASRVHVKVGAKVSQTITVSPDSWTIYDAGQYKVFKGGMTLYCGGQQPHQEKQVGSNVLEKPFKIL